MMVMVCLVYASFVVSCVVCVVVDPTVLFVLLLPDTFCFLFTSSNNKKQEEIKEGCNNEEAEHPHNIQIQNKEATKTQKHCCCCFCCCLFRCALCWFWMLLLCCDSHIHLLPSLSSSSVAGGLTKLLFLFFVDTGEGGKGERVTISIPSNYIGQRQLQPYRRVPMAFASAAGDLFISCLRGVDVGVCITQHNICT